MQLLSAENVPVYQMGFEVNPEMSQNSLHHNIPHSVMTIMLTPVVCHYSAKSNWFRAL
jgi:hypothetical protein